MAEAGRAEVRLSARVRELAGPAAADVVALAVLAVGVDSEVPADRDPVDKVPAAGPDSISPTDPTARAASPVRAVRADWIGRLAARAMPQTARTQWAGREVGQVLTI